MSAYQCVPWYARYVVVRALWNSSRCPVFRLTAIGWVIKRSLLHHENEYVCLWAVSLKTGQRHLLIPLLLFVVPLPCKNVKSYLAHMSQLKLFMVLIGCRPQGRLIEQHDIFFGVANTLGDLLPAMAASWPEAKGRFHIDAWREVTRVDGHNITIAEGAAPAATGKQLYFINLGGYKPGDFEEYHYKVLSVAPDMSTAVRASKQTAFYKHASIAVKGGESHIDDKYGVDADDLIHVNELLANRYTIHITEAATGAEDELHIGYLKADKLK